MLPFVGDDVIAVGDKLVPDTGAPEQVVANLGAIDAGTFLFGRATALLSLICLVVFILVSL